MKRRHALYALLLVAASACDTETAQHKAAGNLLFNQGKYSEAKESYERAVASNPTDPGARTLLGNAFVELEDYTAAKEQFARALAADDKSPEAHRGMMTVVAHTATPGDPAAFATYLGHAKAIVAERPKDKSALILVAMVLSEAANPADEANYKAAQNEAEKYLRQALELDDRDPQLLFHLALVYARKGELEVGQRVIDRLERLSIRPGFHHYTAAIVYAIGGDREKAFTHLKEYLATGSPSSEDLAKLRHPTSYLKGLHADPQFAAIVGGAAPAP